MWLRYLFSSRVLYLHYIFFTLFSLAPYKKHVSNKNFHLASDLKPYNDKWRVLVKLIHSWIQTPPYADETLGMVLADETVSSTI